VKDLIFRVKVTPLFLDLLSHPYTRDFLIQVFEALRKNKAQLVIGEAYGGGIFSTLPAGSCAFERQRLTFFSPFTGERVESDRRFDLNINFEDPYMFMQGEDGRVYLEKMSLTTTVAHELKHIMDMLSGWMVKATTTPESIPDSHYLTSAAEKRAITGRYQENEIERQDAFCEHTVARARGEKVRLFHKGIPLDPHMGKEPLLHLCLAVGADGTAVQLLQAAVIRKGKVERYLAAKRVGMTHRFGRAISKEIGVKCVKFFQQWLTPLDRATSLYGMHHPEEVLDLDALDPEALNDAYTASPMLSHKEADREGDELLQKGKNRALLYLQVVLQQEKPETFRRLEAAKANTLKQAHSALDSLRTVREKLDNFRKLYLDPF
jgi:hypothetical protein